MTILLWLLSVSVFIAVMNLVLLGVLYFKSIKINVQVTEEEKGIRVSINDVQKEDAITNINMVKNETLSIYGAKEEQ